MSFEAVMARWASLDEADVARPWLWRDGKLDVRSGMYRLLEEAQEAVVRTTAAPASESRRVLSLAQRAFGDLRGLLVGLPDELMDKAPRPNEWPVREVLRHVLLVERRYAIQTAYAIERRDSDPVRIADDRMPAARDLDVSGAVGDVLGRIADARAETNRRLADVAPSAMARPTVWVGVDVDVRFRLHRFAAHLVEHTIHCEKTLAGVGWRPTEGRRIVRQIWSTVGELEGLGASEELRALDTLAVERDRSVLSAP